MNSFFKKHKKYFFVLLLLFVGILVYFFVGIFSLSKGLCVESDFKNFSSPDGAHTATLFNRDCGATTRTVGWLRLDNKEILSMGSHYEDSLSVSWKNNEELNVFYHFDYPADLPETFEKNVNGVHINYIDNPCIGIPEGQCKE